WSVPNNLLNGQQVVYNLTISEVQSGQTPEAAITNNAPWKEIVTAPNASPNGFDALLQDSIPKTKTFVWQVKANSGAQTVAQSSAYTFNGPPLIEECKAGEHTVIVSELENQDLDALSGKGFIKIGEGDSGKVEIAFESLDINKVSGKYVLNNGEIL